MLVEVKKTKNKGLGLFARRDIRRGELVFTIRGKIKTDDEWSKTKVNQEHLHQVDWDKFMLVEPPSCFCNHSCNPNCGDRGNKFYAMKNIKKGQEITVDYDTFEWDWIMKCKCGEENCRKVIRGFKFLPDKTKKKYLKLGIVADYLLKNKQVD